MKGFSWRVSSVQVPAIEYSSRHRRGSVTWLDGGGGRSSPHKRRTRAPGVIGPAAGVHRRLVTTAVGLTLAANAGPPAMRYPAISEAIIDLFDAGVARSNTDDARPVLIGLSVRHSR